MCGWQAWYTSMKMPEPELRMENGMQSNQQMQERHHRLQNQSVTISNLFSPPVDTRRHEVALTISVESGLVSDDDFGHALDYDPLFAAVMKELRGEFPARQNSDAFYPVESALLEDRK